MAVSSKPTVSLRTTRGVSVCMQCGPQIRGLALDGDHSAGPGCYRYSHALRRPRSRLVWGDEDAMQVRVCECTLLQTGRRSRMLVSKHSRQEGVKKLLKRSAVGSMQGFVAAHAIPALYQWAVGNAEGCAARRPSAQRPSLPNPVRGTRCIVCTAGSSHIAVISMHAASRHVG
jgi:hypothetical protein